MNRIYNILTSVYKKIPSFKRGKKWVGYEENGVGLIDVGAAGKLPSPWYENAPFISYLLNFEPRDRESSSENIISISTALWESNEERPFYVLKGKDGTGSSLLEPNVEFVQKHIDELSSRGPEKLARTWFDRSEVVRRERVQCQTLDSVISSIPRDYHFMKLDVQGAELQVLRGSEDFLESSCLGLHLELFKYPLYKDMALMDDVIDYLKKKNFDLCIKYPPHGSFNSQHDCVFIHRHKEGKLKDKIRSVYNIPN